MKELVDKSIEHIFSKIAKDDVLRVAVASYIIETARELARVPLVAPERPMSPCPCGCDTD